MDADAMFFSLSSALCIRFASMRAVDVILLMNAAFIAAVVIDTFIESLRKCDSRAVRYTLAVAIDACTVALTIEIRVWIPHINVDPRRLARAGSLWTLRLIN